MKPVAIACGLLGFATAGGALWAAGEASRPRVLAGIQPGQWVLRGVDGSTSTRAMCVVDPSVLLQLRHPNTGCSRITLEDGPARGQVHYTCPGHGHGDTTIRIETPALIHIDSQGIADNAPFNISIEARRTGGCGR